jgi:phosphoribosylglycinamide formyltransferase 1
MPKATENRKLRLAVLVSGSGTNLQALLEQAAANALAGEIVVVASDRADAYGLQRARTARIPAHVVDYQAHLRGPASAIPAQNLAVDLQELDRRQKILRESDPVRRLDRLARLVSAEQELVHLLDRYQPDCVCLAGFMRLVTPYFLSHYNRPDDYRVVNIHPALLPAFPGQHGYDDTVAYGCKWGGITVHFADEGEDSGPIIAQAVYPIWPDDDLETVRRRGLQLEYTMYAQCINWMAAGQIALRQGPDGRPLVAIIDPTYPQVVHRWLRQAMDRYPLEVKDAR